MNTFEETILLEDSITRDEVMVNIRTVDENVGICLSAKNDGDVEIFVNFADCQNIIEILQKAVLKEK